MTDDIHVQNTSLEPLPQRVTERTARQGKTQGIILRHKIKNQRKYVAGVKELEKRARQTHGQGHGINLVRIRAEELSLQDLRLAHHMV